MTTTCIKFVSHTNEPDCVVFFEYKHPNQERGLEFLLKHTKLNCMAIHTCNDHLGHVGLDINGTMEVVPSVNREVWHIVSLWRDFECFNKLDIIRLISNILGFQAKSSTSISKNGRSIYGIKRAFFAHVVELRSRTTS